ncbi:MAG: hypothetical protein PHN75_08705, partial [Syntrophales bacterium]|nr:hypothetical protein [Syntrophales bacterium]
FTVAITSVKRRYFFALAAGFSAAGFFSTGLAAATAGFFAGAGFLATGFFSAGFAASAFAAGFTATFVSAFGFAAATAFFFALAAAAFPFDMAVSQQITSAKPTPTSSIVRIEPQTPQLSASPFFAFAMLITLLRFFIRLYKTSTSDLLFNRYKKFVDISS